MMEIEKFYNLLGNQHLLNQETLNDLKELTKEYPWFQLGWLLYLKNLKETESADFETELKKGAVHVTDRKLLYNFIHAEVTRKNQKSELVDAIEEANIKEGAKGKDNSLIDKFLSTAPGKIERQTGDEPGVEGAVVNVAKKSDAESDDMITETLAVIYEQQKNYEKAINAYEKLSLKYPEKSIYFASRIKEIEKLKNTNQ
jgi:tetratricopeptide (TPR) repeat protein